MQNDKYLVPSTDVGDHAHAAAKSIISTIPVFGSVGTELFNIIVSPPLERRKLQWMDDVAEGLRQLEEEVEGILEQLSEKDSFIDTIMQASAIAIKTSQQEKLDALRNTVLNAAKDASPDESLQIMFLSFIDGFTVWHLKFLELFSDPAKWLQQNGKTVAEYMSGSKSIVLEAAFSELTSQRSFYDVIWKDLYFKGLVGNDSLHVMMTGHGMMQKATTDLGDKFVAFIANPL